MMCFRISFLLRTIASQVGHFPFDDKNFFSASTQEDVVESSLSPVIVLILSITVEISGKVTCAFFPDSSTAGLSPMQVGVELFCNVREIVENQLVFTGAKVATALYTSVNILVNKK